MIANTRSSLAKRDEGFTLIELLVVIIIIVILAAIAIPVFLNQRKKGYDAQAKSDLRTLATLQETFLTDKGYYGDLASLVAAPYSFKASPNGGAGSAVVRLRLADGVTPVSPMGPTATGGYALCTISSSGTTWVYLSAGGGLQATTATCPAT